MHYPISQQNNMRIIISLLFFLSFTFGYSQTAKEITIGTVDSLHSTILNEKRKLFISVPKSHNSNESLRYPVMYLLDGETYFRSITGMIEFLSVANGNSVIPEIIVVAIPNTDRIRDLTPSAVTQHPESGKAERFTSFLRKELIPYIDKKYPTTPYRMLMGHSLGGLFAMNTIVHHKDMFQSYLVIDPSLWWDNKKLLTQAGPVVKTSGQFRGKDLFLATSDMGDTAKVGLDTSAKKLPTRAILELIDILTDKQENQLRFDHKVYKDENHGSVPLISTYDGLHFFFDFFKRPSFARIPDTTFNADSILKSHYENVSKRMGYNVSPPESLVSGIAWLYAINKVNDSAIHFYKLNLSYYPNSLNAYYSLAQFYESIGDSGNAILYYDKSLRLKDVSDVREKIAELKAKKK